MWRLSSGLAKLLPTRESLPKDCDELCNECEFYAECTKNFKADSRCDACVRCRNVVCDFQGCGRCQVRRELFHSHFDLILKRRKHILLKLNPPSGQGPIDYIKTCLADDTPLFLSQCEVAKHVNVWDGWVVCGNRVYDVTSYIKKHPAGVKVLLAYLGGQIDASDSMRFHSQNAREVWEKCFLGTLLKRCGGVCHIYKPSLRRKLRLHSTRRPQPNIEKLRIALADDSVLG